MDTLDVRRGGSPNPLFARRSPFRLSQFYRGDKIRCRTSVGSIFQNAHGSASRYESRPDAVPSSPNESGQSTIRGYPIRFGLSNLYCLMGSRKPRPYDYKRFYKDSSTFALDSRMKINCPRITRNRANKNHSFIGV